MTLTKKQLQTLERLASENGLRAVPGSTLEDLDDGTCVLWGPDGVPRMWLSTAFAKEILDGRPEAVQAERPSPEAE